MQSYRCILSLLVLVVLQLEAPTRNFFALANPFAMTANTRVTGSKPQELEAVLSIYNQPKHNKNIMTVLNEYLCKNVKSEDPIVNLNELAKIGSQLDRLTSKTQSSKTLQSFLEKYRIIVELIVRAKDKTGQLLCTQEGQNAVQTADVQMIYHARLMNLYAQVEGRVTKCTRINMIIDYFTDVRRKRCELGGYFVKSLAQNYDALPMDTQRSVVGALSDFMNIIYEKLGGFSTISCKKRLSHEIDRIENFDYIAGQTLMDGLSLVADNNAMESLSQMTSSETAGDYSHDTEFLNRFVELRDKHLMKPCRLFMNQMDNIIKQIRLYESLYGSYSEKGEQIQFVSNTQEDRRFYRSWALYNVCELLVSDRQAKLTVALLRAFKFDIEQSRVDKQKMVSILESR